MKHPWGKYPFSTKISEGTKARVTASQVQRASYTKRPRNITDAKRIEVELLPGSRGVGECA